MKSFMCLLIFLLIFSNVHDPGDLIPSETLQKSNLEESTNSRVNSSVSDEPPSTLLFCNWEFQLFANGTANGYLELGLNWTGNRELFRLHIPRTMQIRPNEHVKAKKFVIYPGESIRPLDINPIFMKNTVGTIMLDFHWPLASYFYQNRWYFPAFEYLSLFPDDNEITTEQMQARVVLPSGTQEDSITIDLESYNGFIGSLTKMKF